MSVEIGETAVIVVSGRTAIVAPENLFGRGRQSGGSGRSGRGGGNSSGGRGSGNSSGRGGGGRNRDGEGDNAAYNPYEDDDEYLVDDGEDYEEGDEIDEEASPNAGDGGVNGPGGRLTRYRNTHEWRHGTRGDHRRN